MHRYVSRSDIIERIEHIRALHRQRVPSDEQERTAFARRERKTKDLLSNLRRTGEIPTLRLIRDFGDLNAMTVDAAHRLFGYRPDAIRDFDLLLNGARTHVVESYVFNRDRLVALPLELERTEAYSKSRSLGSLVREWQTKVPIRSLSRPEWQHSGAFYLHIGAEDSFGSSLPPGSLALVQPITKAEASQPNPRSVYALQFPNGYRCSRCVVSRGRLHLLTSERTHYDRTAYHYPGSVRIIGRVGMFATTLPVLEYPKRKPLSHYAGSGPLVLPWEQPNRDSLLAAEYKRFVRPLEEQQRLHQFLEQTLNHQLSERSKRRYRAQTQSEPHVPALIHMALESSIRYTDALRSGGHPIKDAGHYSLAMLLQARTFEELLAGQVHASTPFPTDTWHARRKEIAEWPAIFSLKFPDLRSWEDRVVRVAESAKISGLEPPISKGSWLLLGDVAGPTVLESTSIRHGWSHPLYVLQQGLDLVLGYLQREGEQFALSDGSPQAHGHSLSLGDLQRLRPVFGIAVPL